MQKTLIHVPASYLTVPLASARAILSMDDEQIHERIELGRLRCVWNIATPGADKRTLRFLDAELRAWPETAAIAGDARALAARLFGEAKPFVDGTDFRRAFNCDSDTVLNLIRAGVLAVLPNTGWRRGPNGTPAIAWASAMKFVKERKL